MNRKMVAAAVVGLCAALTGGCGTTGGTPEPEHSATVEMPEAGPIGEPADSGEAPQADPPPAPQEEWEENVFASESGVACAFFFRDGAVNEYVCYLPEPSFETTDGVGTPIDCEGEPYVLDALIDSEMDPHCATTPLPAGLLVLPGQTEEQATVACSGVGEELQCSFPYGQRGMGIDVSNDGFIAYMQDDDSHNPGTDEGKEYFLPIPYRSMD